MIEIQKFIYIKLADKHKPKQKKRMKYENDSKKNACKKFHQFSIIFLVNHVHQSLKYSIALVRDVCTLYELSSQLPEMLQTKKKYISIIITVGFFCTYVTKIDGKFQIVSFLLSFPFFSISLVRGECEKEKEREKNRRHEGERVKVIVGGKPFAT